METEFINIPMPTDTDNDEMKKRKRERDVCYQILKATTEFYQENLKNNPDSLQAKYLARRGMNAEMIEKLPILLNFIAISSIVSTFVPVAYTPPTNAPIEVPTIKSGTIPFFSRTFKIPI